jgi:hypothetical protein
VVYGDAKSVFGIQNRRHDVQRRVRPRFGSGRICSHARRNQRIARKRIRVLADSIPGPSSTSMTEMMTAKRICHLFGETNLAVFWEDRSRRTRPFSFGAYEGLRQARSDTTIAVVPTVAAKRGILPCALPANRIAGSEAARLCPRGRDSAFTTTSSFHSHLTSKPRSTRLSFIASEFVTRPRWPRRFRTLPLCSRLRIWRPFRWSQSGQQCPPPPSTTTVLRSSNSWASGRWWKSHTSVPRAGISRVTSSSIIPTMKL